jgi:uncharacterized protein
MKTEIPTIAKLDLESLTKGEIHRFNLHIVSDGMGNPINLPVIIAKGIKSGPTIGLIAALHGNEINGLPVIQRTFQNLDPKKMKGNVIGLLVANIPGFLLKQRRFNDNSDLNHIMPGNKHGNRSQIYAYRIMRKIVRNCQYIIDLHTASFGRINSYYVRADLENPIIKKMALLQNTDIILHNKGAPGTLRRAATDLGIPTITVELRDPHRIQKDVVAESALGVQNVLIYLAVITGEIENQCDETVICKSSEWLYTDNGGLLDVVVQLREHVVKDQLIARTRNIFGDVIREYFAPYAGIVIGRSIEPVSQTGARLIHLGKTE